MSRFVLELCPDLYTSLRAHLIRVEQQHEEAAFLFVAADEKARKLTVLDHYFAHANDFAAQGSDYLELTDESRLRLIKTAHRLNACLTEIHSHPWPIPAMFSLADNAGLRDNVPHIRWRLRSRPYVAIVVGPDSFDALVWRRDDLKAEALKGIQVGATLLGPTNLSLRSWS